MKDRRKIRTKPVKRTQLTSFIEEGAEDTQFLTKEVETNKQGSREQVEAQTKVAREQAIEEFNRVKSSNEQKIKNDNDKRLNAKEVPSVKLEKQRPSTSRNRMFEASSSRMSKPTGSASNLKDKLKKAKDASQEAKERQQMEKEDNPRFKS